MMVRKSCSSLPATPPREKGEGKARPPSSFLSFMRYESLEAMGKAEGHLPTSAKVPDNTSQRSSSPTHCRAGSSGNTPKAAQEARPAKALPSRRNSCLFSFPTGNKDQEKPFQT